MNRERQKKAMDLCNEFVNLFNLPEKEKFKMIDKIGEIYLLGELHESDYRHSNPKQG